MKTHFNTFAVLLVLLVMNPFVSRAQSDIPPETITNTIRPDDPVVTRVFYDDEIAVYFGDGMDPEVNWMNDFIKNSWIYIKETYGYFGPDNRIYVVAHKNPEYNFATINTRFDPGFGFRNVIDLGGAWDWENPQQVNFEVIAHELSHIVEGGSKDIGGGSPSFVFWADGPWPEIFVYDLYRALGEDAWADDWLERMLKNTNTHLGGTERFFFFRDWFYPLYQEFGGAEFYNTYFNILSENLYTRPRTVQNGEQAKQYARRATFGEILHFTSAAAKTDQEQRFIEVFGWTEAREEELFEAQKAYPLFYEGNPHNPDKRIDITDEPGTISAEFEVGSPANEEIDKIIDNVASTKYLTFNPAGYVQFQSDDSWVVNSYAIISGGDAPGRDPFNWTFEGSNDGETWVTLDERTEEDFVVRYLHRYFDFQNEEQYSYYRFNFNTEDATLMQVSEIRIFSEKNVLSIDTNTSITKNTIQLYPNPVDNVLNIKGVTNKAKVTIFSMIGELVYESNTKDVSAGIDVSNLVTGPYLLQIEEATGKSTHMIVKD